MPRKVRDANLETRTARSRLSVRHDPFYRLIEPGLHLGYRKLTSGPGTWVLRRYGTDKQYVRENLRTRDGELILADDFSDADGVTILSFAQAQELAQAKSQRAEAAKPYTVADAMRDYLHHLEHDGRAPHAVYDARRRIDGFILPALGGSGSTRSRRNGCGDGEMRSPPHRRGCGRAKARSKNTASLPRVTMQSEPAGRRRIGRGPFCAQRSTTLSTREKLQATSHGAGSSHIEPSRRHACATSPSPRPRACSTHVIRHSRSSFVGH